MVDVDWGERGLTRLLLRSDAVAIVDVLSFSTCVSVAADRDITIYPVPTGEREMVISESPGGSYMVYGKVNGTPVPFLIDTGASDIVLSPGDARRIGIDVDGLDFAHVYETANGQGRGAPYRVASLQVGDIVLHDVAVSINQAPMQSSLLGAAFLRKLKSFGFGDHQMVLRW